MHVAAMFGGQAAAAITLSAFEDGRRDRNLALGRGRGQNGRAFGESAGGASWT